LQLVRANKKVFQKQISSELAKLFH